MIVGRSRPDPVRDEVAVRHHPEPHEGLGDAHRQGGRLLGEDDQRAARRRLSHGVSSTRPAEVEQHRQHVCRPPDGPRDRLRESAKNEVRDIPGTAGRPVQDSWKAKPRLTLNIGLRGSIFDPGRTAAATASSCSTSPSTPPTSRPGSSSPASPGTRLTRACRCRAWARPSTSSRASASPGTSVAPARTVLRGGAGLYLWHDAQQPYNTLVTLSAGTKQYSTCCGTTLKDVEALAGSGSLAFNGRAIDINDDKQPKTWTWSLTVNQKLPYSMNLEVGYVGNYQQDQINWDSANINAIPLGAMHRQPGRRPEPVPAVPAIRRQLPDQPPQHDRDVPRPAGPPRAAAGQLQLHRGLHLLEGPRVQGDRGRRADPVGVQPHALPRLQLRRPQLRPHARGVLQLQLAPPRAEFGGCHEAGPRWLAAGGHPELRERSAPERQLRPDGHHVRGRSTWAATRSRAAPTAGRTPS